MQIFGYVSLLLLATVGAIGKVLIKKSVEYDSETQRRVLNLIGIFFMAILLPFANISSYYFADNAIVAPISSSSILFNLLFAKIFLEEGQHMGSKTLLGIIAFVTGLFLIVFTYSSLVGNETDDEVFDWGVLSLYLGIWMILITILSNTANIFNNNRQIQLFGWSIASGLLTGTDIVASMDKWIWNHDRDDNTELTKGIIASVFFAFAAGTGIFVINELLTDPDNPMHIVASIVATTTLFADVIADCFVFERYKLWDQNNYAMAIIGLILMIVGINILQTSAHTNKYEQLQQREPELELNSTISIDTKNTQKANSLTPPPSLESCARSDEQLSC